MEGGKVEILELFAGEKVINLLEDGNFEVVEFGLRPEEKLIGEQKVFPEGGEEEKEIVLDGVLRFVKAEQEEIFQLGLKFEILQKLQLLLFFEVGVGPDEGLN